MFGEPRCGICGKDKPKITDDLSGQARLFKLLIYVAVVKPLLSIATQGQEAQREEERKKWEAVGAPKTLADLFRTQESETPLVMKVAAAAKAKE